MYVCTPCSRLDNKLYGRIKTTSVKNEREKKKTIHASFLATIIVNTRVKKKKKKKRKTVKIVSEKGLKKRGHAKRKRKKKIPNESTTKKNFAYFETPHS